jgi:hypothetical protein
VLQRWPDLLTFLYVELSFVHFVGFFGFVYWLQLTNVKTTQPVHLTLTHTEKTE